jgi:hypothetical protein
VASGSEVYGWFGFNQELASSRRKSDAFAPVATAMARNPFWAVADRWQRR